MEIAYFDQMNGTNLLVELDMGKLDKLQQTVLKVGSHIDNAVEGNKSGGHSRGNTTLFSRADTEQAEAFSRSGVTSRYKASDAQTPGMFVLY